MDNRKKLSPKLSLRPTPTAAALPPPSHPVAQPPYISAVPCARPEFPGPGAATADAAVVASGPTIAAAASRRAPSVFIRSNRLRAVDRTYDAYIFVCVFVVTVISAW